jgi:hypothetical protein
MLHHERSVTDLGQSIFARALALPAKHLADEQAGDRAKGIRATSQQKSQFERHAQYPLTNRHIGQYMIYEMRSAVAHASGRARRATAAFFAGKGHQNGAATFFANGLGESIL